MRVPSDALDKIAPAWMPMRRSPAYNKASSPNTKTGVPPRKCTPTIVASTSTRRTRSASEGRGAWMSLTSGDAVLKALSNSVFWQIAAYENDTTVPILIRAPRPLVIAIEDHVHALKHETLRIVLEPENAFAAEDIGSVFGNQILNPGKELVRIEWPVGLHRNRLHLLVVVMLEPVTTMVVTMIMVMMIVVMVVVVMMLSAVQEGGFDFEDPIEIEGIAPEHLVNVDVRALGPVQSGVRIKRANACFELAQFLRRHQIGLVDQDDIREGNLVLG